MQYRVVEIAWTPSSAEQWRAFTVSRLAAGQLWSDLVVRHARIRRLGLHLKGRHKFKWPTKKRLEKWVKRRYPGLVAQSAQQSVKRFLEAVNSTRQLHKHGHPEARYPWKRPRYGDVTYTNQNARIRSGCLLLPNGQAGTLRVKLPSDIVLPGHLMEVCLSFGRVRLVCKLDEPKTVDGETVVPAPAVTIGVDLGVNTLIAAGDDQRAVLISGREAKATVQWRAKNLASVFSAQSKLTKRSRRWMKLQRRKHKVRTKSDNRIKDITHKATRKVADAFPNARVIVGKPFNDAAENLPRKQAQQVASASNAKIIAQLAYKLAGVTQVEEHYTSQTCPVCGERRRVGRVYKCKSCGFQAPRDVVGLTNIRRIGIHGGMVPSPDVPRQVTYVLPHHKYPGETRRSKDRRSQVVPGEPRQVARRAA